MSVSKLSKSSGWGDNSRGSLQKRPFQLWFPQRREGGRARGQGQGDEAFVKDKARGQNEDAGNAGKAKSTSAPMKHPGAAGVGGGAGMS